MAFEPNFEKVVASVRKRVGVVQSQVECKLPTTEEVKQILCSNAKVNVVNVEISGRDIIYYGFVNFQILYMDKNQSPISMDYTAEFKDKYQCDVEYHAGVPVVNASIIDVNTIVNHDIKAVAIVEVIVDVIENNPVTVLANIVGNSYYVQRDLLKYSTFVNMVSNKFETFNDIEIKDGVSKVLSVCPSVFIEKVTPSDRFLTLTGGLYFDICYLTDNGIIRTMQSNCDFTQEVAQDDLNIDSILQNDLQILCNDIKVTTNIDVDNALLNIELPLLYKGYIFENNSVEIVSDLYSTKHFTNVVVESMKSLDMFDTLVFNEKLNGSITIQENDAFIDELLGSCCSSVVVANNVVENNRLTVEGVATITVLYLNKETNNVYSVEVEMPFSISKNIDFIDGVNSSVKVALTNIQSRARRGREIEVSANLEVYTDIFSMNENAVITNIVEEDEIPESECAMSFYLTKDGDTIWEIAKELRVSTDMLLAQNSNLADPISPGTRVVVYRQRQVEF